MGVGRGWHRLSTLLSLVLFVVALWVLTRELRALSLEQLRESAAALPRSSIAVALLVIALNYFVLTWYDQLAFVYAGCRISRWRIALASFVGYAVSNNVGFAVISGASARYRFYSRWGLSGQELSKIVAFYNGTFWVGLLTLGGLTLLVGPVPGVEAVLSAPGARVAGALLIAICWAYPVLALIRRAPLRIGSAEIPLPQPRLVVGQFVLSTIDWALLVSALYVLLPAPRLPFFELAGAVLAGQLAGLISQVPGGLGVFESAVLLLLGRAMPASALLPAVVLFRVLYYLVPLGASLVVLLIDEAVQRRHHVARWGNAFGTLALSIAPKLIALFTFIAGAVLLLSGAMPVTAARAAWIEATVPLPVVEVSHLAASLCGVLLLLVSQGLGRRLRAAYALAVAGLTIGVIASLLKGADYRELLALGALLVILVPAGDNFTRIETFFDTSFPPEWLLGVVTVVAASIWLGMFAFRHVDYAGQLWSSAWDQDAARFLRASIGALVMLAAFGVLRLARPSQAAVAVPAEADLQQAARVIEAQDETFPNLVFLRDKGILWNAARTAFIMYGVEDTSWIALGDPVGPPEEAPALVRQFVERVDDFNGTPIFYEVRHDALHLYADYGLTFVKLGDEARVSLDGIRLESPVHQGHRDLVERVAREGARFRVLSRREVADRLKELHVLSNAWIAKQAAVEKGFALAFFDPAYVSRFPVAVIEHRDRIVAFASLWPSERHVELSLDLMRCADDAPEGAMEALFVHVMAWGHEQGYRWLALGMAPLSGLMPSDVSPIWTRLGSFAYRHGEAFRSFRGLREYQEKFSPEWLPRYLAYPGGQPLSGVLRDVAALIVRPVPGSRPTAEDAARPEPPVARTRPRLS